MKWNTEGGLWARFRIRRSPKVKKPLLVDEEDAEGFVDIEMRFVDGTKITTTVPMSDWSKALSGRALKAWCVVSDFENGEAA